MPIRYQDGAIRYTPEEVAAMWARGEICPHDAAGSLERIDALLRPAGMPTGFQVHPERRWLNLTPRAARERSARGGAAKARRRAA